MARHVIGPDSPLFENAMHGHGTCQDRGLGIRRELQFVFGPCKTHLRNRESQRAVRLVKHGARRRMILRELFAHARVLRRLPRK